MNEVAVGLVAQGLAIFDNLRAGLAHGVEPLALAEATNGGGPGATSSSSGGAASASTDVKTTRPSVARPTKPRGDNGTI